mmetsp:Transcript_7184/g.20927  ORF Transcript_7184/g.20927 Transcript_7184/m.20927 type:complete len:312 (+) Transcript_7184:54-989(+)
MLCYFSWLFLLLATNAGPGHVLEEALHFRGAAREAVGPELVPWVLDELDKGDQQAPRVGPVHDEPLQEDSGDLLLHDLHRRLCEEEEEDAAEVVGVAVGVPQLVRHGVQKDVPALRVQVQDELLEHLHRNGLPLVDGVHADVEDERVDQGHVVLGARAQGLDLRQEELLGELRQKVRGLPHAQVRVQRDLQAHQGSVEVHDDPWGLRNLGQEVHLEVWSEGVGQPHVPREGAEHQVPHLDAARRDDVAELEVVLAKELREVVEQHQQHPERSLVDQPYGLGELGAPQVGLQELQERDQQLLVVRPPVLPSR